MDSELSKGVWDASKHPRGAHGHFASSGSAGAPAPGTIKNGTLYGITSSGNIKLSAADIAGMKAIESGASGGKGSKGKSAGKKAAAKAKKAKKPVLTKAQKAALLKSKQLAAKKAKEKALVQARQQQAQRLKANSFNAALPPSNAIQSYFGNPGVKGGARGTALAKIGYPATETPLGTGDNWVTQAGGLPMYMRRVANHLIHDKGYDESAAVAMAVNWCKHLAETGRTFGNKVKVNDAARAEAAKAVAEWEAKKAKAHGTHAAKDSGKQDSND